MGQTGSDHTSAMENGQKNYRIDPEILRHTGSRLFLLASVLHHVVSWSCHSWSRMVRVRTDDDS